MTEAQGSSWPLVDRRNSSRGAVTISPTGTNLQLGFVLTIVLSTAAGVGTFIAARSKADALNETVTAMKADVGALTRVAQDLNLTITELKGGVNNLTEKVGALQVSAAQGERDAQAQAIRLTKIEADLALIKDRLTVAESTQKTIEARLLSVEIVGKSLSQPTTRGADGK